MNRNENNQFHKNIIEHQLDAMHAELHSDDYENVKYVEDNSEAECQDNPMWGNQEIADDEKEYLATRDKLDELYDDSNLNELLSSGEPNINDLEQLNLFEKYSQGMEAIKELENRLIENLKHELIAELKTWPEVWVVETGTEDDTDYIYDEPRGVQVLLVGIYKSKEEAVQVVKNNFARMREAGFKMKRRDDGYPSCRDDIAPDLDGATSFIQDDEDVFEVRPGWTGEDGETETAVYGWHSVRNCEREPFISAIKVDVDSEDELEGVFEALLDPYGHKRLEGEPDIQRNGEREMQSQTIQSLLAVLGKSR